MRRLSFGLESSRLNGRRRCASRVNLETLEDRRLLATFTVTNTNDAGTDSLREAILNANASPGADIINFNIAGSGVHTISLTSGQLPTIVDTLTIDGTTQPVNGGPVLTTPLVEIDGSTIPASVTAVANGLTLNLPVGSSPSTIRGLAISGFSGSGILITGAGNNAIQGNLVGVTADGKAARPNAIGIVINGSPNNTVGGTSTTFRNVISGNTGPGISISGVAATGNAIQGNLIGTDVTGTNAIANANGVVITGSTSNTVGGAIVASRNVISGNTGSGVLITTTSTSNNAVQGNYIGLNQSGSTALPNLIGIQISAGAASNSIGGTASGTRNIVSGNTNVQIFITASTNNSVLGNTVGLDSNGVASLTGSQAVVAGILLQDGAIGNTIGGITATASNVISGSSGPGLWIRGLSTTGSGTVSANNLIQGNSIGTDLAGTVARPNAGGGLLLSDGTTGNTVGGTAGGLARNVISGNTGAGVALTSAATTGNVIQANSIGVQADNTTALANTGDGVYVGGAVNNQIGGSVAAASNTIANNAGAGVFVESGDRISIRHNAIFTNSNLGIDLAPRGVNPNTTNPGVGPNDLQNYPVLTSVVTSGTTTTINGSLTSAPSRSYIVEFYSNPAVDPSGHGQGRTFLGQTTVTTGTDGVGSFSFPTTTAVPLNSVVSATATDPNGNTSEFAADIQNVAPSVDLLIQLADIPDPVAIGGVLTYSIGVANGGPSTATNVIVTNTLPTGASFIGATSSQGTINQTGSTVTANLGSLAVGGTATITITVVAPSGPTLTDSATVTATESDANQANNTATVTTSAVAGPNLVLTSQASPSQGAVGTPETITFTVTNSSTTVTATNVVLNAALPTNATLVSSSATQGATSSNSATLLAALGSLAPGVSAQVNFVVNPTSAGTLTSTASVTSDAPDVNPSNNSSAAVVNISASTTPVVIDGPRVLALDRTGYRTQPTTYVTTFSGPLDVASATSKANYLVIGAGPDRKIGTNDDVRLTIRRPFYDATTNTVSVRTRKRVSLHKHVLFAINGTSATGVRGANGQLLDGNNDGTPGSNFTRTFKGVGPGRIQLS